MYRDQTVAAVVPAYNEAGFVGDVIDELPSFLDRAYVVEDGSTDDTWAEIRRHAVARNADHEGVFADLVVPIQHDQNRGVGGAIKTGYLRAREEEIDVTVVLGGDNQMDPEQLTRYIDPIVDGIADYTKGNRFARPEDRAAMPRLRLIGNVALSYLTKVASGYWGSMDSQNGYTAISLSALRRTDIEGMYEYYGYCNDLLVRLNVAGVTIADVPRSSDYAYSDGWKSHIEYREYVPRVSLMLFRGFRWRLWEKYVLQRYEPIAPLYLLGTGALGAGVTGLLATLGRRAEGAGSWVLTSVVGALLFVYAGLLDQADNESLEHHLEAVDGESADDETSYSVLTDSDATPVETGSQRHHPNAVANVPGRTDGGSESTAKDSEPGDLNRLTSTGGTDGLDQDELVARRNDAETQTRNGATNE